ncbi:MAG: serine/threonine protein kinase [Solobacterium sp.]|nr:serine/threonine protein kinase [Solobacterium sp.]
MAQILNNTYEIQEFIGSGGMSTVFRARHIRLGIDVAVKSVRKNQTVNLLAEVNILTRLNHPNLVRVIDIFEDERLLYIVMDYVEGENLQCLIDRVKVVPESQVMEWFKTMADALRYLHTRRPPIIYRDMKPANIILQKDGILKLIDFGIAREYKPAASGDTTYVGTNGFAAPEQFGRAQTDARTDIYSLGMTMYYLATGKSPLDPPYGYTPARKLNPALSFKMERILGKCIKDNPQDRYQSAEELLTDLFDGEVPASFGYLTTGGLTGIQPDTQPGTDEFATVTTGLQTAGRKNTGSTHEQLPETKLLPPAKKPGSNKSWKWITAAAVLVALLAAGFFTFHIYTEPTCTEPSVCRICGRQLVPALGHSWEAATAERPETCARCGETRGEPLAQPEAGSADAEESTEEDTAGKVSIIGFESTDHSIIVSWADFNGAASYRVYRQIDSGDVSMVKETSAAQFEDFGADHNGSTYKYWVTAVVDGQETEKSGEKTTVFLECSERTGAKVQEDNTLKVAWVVNDQADGYQIRLIQGSTIRIINVSDINDIEVNGEKQQYTVLKDLDMTGTLTVETRCYKMLKETHYSAWSEAREVTIPE